MEKIVVKQKESRPVRLIITRDGSAIDLSNVTLSFVAKRRKEDASFLFTKNDSDFDKTDAGIGIVVMQLTQSDTDLDSSTNYVGELHCLFPDGSLYKSPDITIVVQQAVQK